MNNSGARSSLAIVGQVLTIAACWFAIAIGGFFAYGAAFPGPCGDSWGPGLGVIETWVLNTPVGISALIIAFAVRKGSPTLRRICLWSGGVTLLFPFIGAYFLSRHHCP